ncbi:Os08g0267050 [Oryza sativa Japonica Group]|uniref:Os08g0267050 protein n=1 Tax=Oryza sativa subsp. japonica TaxID=39947 RepID=A0A0P0XDM6_ORYSJ|nr:Os08g0267050 [Oryza sativa Japonica Group]
MEVETPTQELSTPRSSGGLTEDGTRSREDEAGLNHGAHRQWVKLLWMARWLELLDIVEAATAVLAQSPLSRVAPRALQAMMSSGSNDMGDGVIVEQKGDEGGV